MTGDASFGGPIQRGFFNCSVTPTTTSAGLFGNCGPTTFQLGESFYIFATAAPGSVFTGWRGCPQNGVNLATRSCSFTASPGAPTSIVLQPIFTSNVTVTGTETGQGSFTGPGGTFNCQNCGAQAASLPNGAVITIVAKPAPGWVIGGWGGACNAVANTSSTCTFTVSPTNNAFSVAFVQIFTLTVDVNGQGSVTITPGNVSCPPTCTANVVGGTALTLTANPASGFHLTGFSGACGGTTCTFTMTQASSVTVNFAPNEVDANVNNRFVTYNGPNGRERAINTKVTARERISVRITIRRRGNNVATRTFSMNGVRTLKIFLRDGLPAGSYTVQVRMENQFGLTKNPPNRSVHLRAV